MSAYYKPLRGGGSRIIDRASSGRFARASLDTRVCGGCGAIHVPEHREGPGGFPEKVWPEKCRDCGAKLEA